MFYPAKLYHILTLRTSDDMNVLIPVVKHSRQAISNISLN